MTQINYSEVVKLVEADIKISGPMNRYDAFCLLIAKYRTIDSQATLIVNKLFCDGFIEK